MAEGTSRTVGRSRTFKLKMSPAGVEMFLDCHYRLGCLINELLPFGNTLYCALLHLERVDVILIIDDLQTLPMAGLTGDRVCFVGAPSCLANTVARIIERVEALDHKPRLAALGAKLFIVALKRFRMAPAEAVLQAYEDMLQEAGEYIKIPRSRRPVEDRIA
jgi:hypothetical protein